MSGGTHAAEILGNVFQRTLIARLIPASHVRSDELDHMDRSLEVSGVISRLKIDCGEQQQALRVELNGFA